MLNASGQLRVAVIHDRGWEMVDKILIRWIGIPTVSLIGSDANPVR